MRGACTSDKHACHCVTYLVGASAVMATGMDEEACVCVYESLLWGLFTQYRLTWRERFDAWLILMEGGDRQRIRSLLQAVFQN